MLRHILTTFVRAAMASRFQFFTIIFGLSTGMVASLMIYIYVKEETSYDKHHANAAEIFRVDNILEMELLKGVIPAGDVVRQPRYGHHP